MSDHPRVFISYSHDSDAHRVQVLAFAQALRTHGIDADLDQFHGETLLDWPSWCREKMEREASDFVLCVCTAEYRRRIHNQVPPEQGRGVYWEGRLMQQELYDAKGNLRFIPVLFDDEAESSIVEILREKGIDIARRTVAKYRESLRIPSSVERKRKLAHGL